MSSIYQTYLFGCQCLRSHTVTSGIRIIFKNLIPYCAWCRTPLVKGGLIGYEEEHFPEEKKDESISKLDLSKM